MPNYLVTIYQEKFGQVVIPADSSEQAFEKAEEVLKQQEDITSIETYTETFNDKGVAISLTDPEDPLAAVTEIKNDS